MAEKSIRDVKRFLAEGCLIVISILLAFWLQAAWEARQEHQRREGIMLDLREELEFNRSRLARAMAGQNRRVEQIDLLLRELTPSAVGLTKDSLKALQASVSGSTTYEPATGIANLLLASGDLRLLDNSELRAGLARLASQSAHFLINQRYVLDLEPNLTFESGTLFYDVSDYVAGDDVITTASENIRTQYVVYLVAVRDVTRLNLAPQGAELLERLDSLIALLDAGRP